MSIHDVIRSPLCSIVHLAAAVNISTASERALYLYYIICYEFTAHLHGTIYRSVRDCTILSIHGYNPFSNLFICYNPCPSEIYSNQYCMMIHAALPISGTLAKGRYQLGIKPALCRAPLLNGAFKPPWK